MYPQEGASEPSEGPQVAGEFVAYYNEECLHSAIGYMASMDRFEAREHQILEVREQKLVEARRTRALHQTRAPHNQSQKVAKQAAQLPTS